MMIIHLAYLSSRFYRNKAGKFTYRHYQVSNLIPVFEISHINWLKRMFLCL